MQTVQFFKNSAYVEHFVKFVVLLTNFEFTRQNYSHFNQHNRLSHLRLLNFNVSQGVHLTL